MGRIAGAALGAAPVLAVGCAGPVADPPPAALAAPEPAGRAERLADALAMADAAARAANAAALAEAAQRLERMAPAPQTDADAQTLRTWLAALPPETTPMRGRALGPAYRALALPPGATVQLNQTFLGGRSAQIVVRVAQGAAPRLMVRDQSEREVCRAETDPVNCRWVPLYTQRHRIEIVNGGRDMAKFYIVFD